MNEGNGPVYHMVEQSLLERLAGYLSRQPFVEVAPFMAEIGKIMSRTKPEPKENAA